MRFFYAEATLYEMELELEHQFFEENHKLRTLGDLNITSEDYRYLNFRIQGIMKYITKVEVMEQYRLCILTAMVFAVQYERDAGFVLRKYEEKMEQFQQHQYGFCMHMFADTFYDLGLSTYGIGIDSTKELMEVVIMNANIPKKIINALCEILEEYFSQQQCYVLEDELYSKLNRVLACVYPSMAMNHHSRCFTRLLKELYEACYSGHTLLKQLYDEFGTLSKQIIENFYRWVTAYSDTSNHLIEIR